jgi:hypothetical protein
VVAVVLLAVYAVVQAATSASGSPCGSGPGSSVCPTTVVGYVFLFPGLILLGLGAIAVVAVVRDIW